MTSETHAELRTILIVDDEDTFRQTLAMTLRRRSFRILEAESAQQALAVLDQPGQTIDVVLTDVVMPGITGPVLAHKVSELHPGLKVLFMSGYPFRTLERDHGMSHDLSTLFLRKPFDVEMFTVMAAKALAAKVVKE